MTTWLGDSLKPNEAPFQASWPCRNWRNVPGPIYGTDSYPHVEDISPLIVATMGGSFLWRQPVNDEELNLVAVHAMTLDYSSGAFGSDGDKHWTLDAIREWWSERARIASEYRAAKAPVDVAMYFERELPEYLRAYAFFIAEGRRACEGEALPDIEGFKPRPIRLPSTIVAEPIDDAGVLCKRTNAILHACGLEQGRLPFWGPPRRSWGDPVVPGTLNVSPSADAANALKHAPSLFAANPSGVIMYRQPRSLAELDQFVEAARHDPTHYGVGSPPSSYAMREWWNSKDSLKRALDGVFDAKAIEDLFERELHAYAITIAPDVMPPSLEELAKFRLVFEKQPQLPFDIGSFQPNDRRRMRFGGRFDERRPLNLPGPIYGGETDTCGTGPAEAEDYVAMDDGGQEFVFRHPTTIEGLTELARAALTECFDGYGNDGNEHWTPELVREWWSNRAEHAAGWKEAKIPDVDELFADEVPKWLRAYLFFLENKRAPEKDDRLPELEP